ncbi:MAG: DUF3618 domain-containing protein [Caldilineaceae bacterium]|nr:DUF3618 domain-containing protein [Caldilineaceae bacterium]
MTQDNYNNQPRHENYADPARPNRYGDERAGDLRSEQRAVMRGDRDPNDPRVIRQNIERRRAQMSETINRIQYRLDPDRLRYEAEEAVREATIGKVEDMAYKARRKVERTQRGMIQKVKSNPIPAALIGLGLGWLMMSGNNEDEYDYDYDRYRYGYDRYDFDDDYDYDLYDRSRFMGGAEYDMRYQGYPSADYRYGDRGMGRGFESDRSRMDEARGRISQAADSARDQVEGAVHQAQDQLEHVKDRVQEGASELSDRVQNQAQQLRYQARMQSRRTRRNFDQAMDSNPLAVGALALAAGALIGLAVPSTEAENRWMGEHRDELLDEAKEQLQEGMEKVKSVANEAKHAVQEASDDVSKGKSAGQAAKEAINRTEQEARQQNLTSTTKR